MLRGVAAPNRQVDVEVRVIRNLKCFLLSFLLLLHSVRLVYLTFQAQDLSWGSVEIPSDPAWT